MNKLYLLLLLLITGCSPLSIDTSGFDFNPQIEKKSRLVPATTSNTVTDSDFNSLIEKKSRLVPVAAYAKALHEFTLATGSTHFETQSSSQRFLVDQSRIIGKVELPQGTVSGIFARNKTEWLEGLDKVGANFGQQCRFSGRGDSLCMLGKVSLNAPWKNPGEYKPITLNNGKTVEGVELPKSLSFLYKGIIVARVRTEYGVSLVIIPNKTPKDDQELLDIASEIFEAWETKKGNGYKEGRIRLPKFDLRKTVNGYLIPMGIALSGYVVDQAGHQARVAITDKGSVSESTAYIGASRGMGVSPHRHITVKKPFIYISAVGAGSENYAVIDVSLINW